MSCNYAEGLSEYENKGKLGLPESFDSEEEVAAKVKQLARWMEESQHVVVHTGAGISTSAGIPDFRGPRGVWTLEKKGLKPDMNVSWDDARPTKTHMALAELTRTDRVKFVVTQNIDGMHMRTGMRRSRLAELHGNMFVDQCNTCRRQFVRGTASPTVGQKVSGTACPAKKANGRACRGRLADFVLDWEDELPDSDLDLSDAHSCLADLSIVMGSTLQIVPAGNLPTYTKKYHRSGKLVVINLQPTKHDKKADLIIHSYVDGVMERLFDAMGMELPQYKSEFDPTVRVLTEDIEADAGFIEWTQSSQETKAIKESADRLDDEYKLKRKLLKSKKTLDDGVELKTDEENAVKPKVAKEERDDLPSLEDLPEVKTDCSAVDVKAEDVKLEKVVENIKVESHTQNGESKGAADC